MRSFLAGLLILALTSAAFAQVRGEVESIGFGNGYYRPECWTPMVVRLQSTIDDPAEYRIEIHQHDLDFDHVIYTKDGITLNGQATQRWELCFLPEPIHGGLPDGSVRDLQDRLRVYLTNKDGTRQLLQLPITSPVQSLDPVLTGFSAGTGNKLILFVVDGSSRPALSEADYDKAIGLVERPVPVMIRPASLPQSVLAYQAVDAVVWIGGDAHALSEEGSKQFTALRQWVRQGGMLVVCQPSNDGDRPKIQPFADMLPILWNENNQWEVTVREKNDLEPLVSLARFKHDDQRTGVKYWNLKGKFPFAHATAKPDAVVDQWITWDSAAKDVTPYIARIPYGLGSVTWVAQDLGNPAITGPKTNGWPYVWDSVFGWKADTHIPGDISEYDQKAYDSPGDCDLGAAQFKGVEFTAKGATLIVLAILFFIAYWVVAGPGSYLFLANRNRKELSWTAFGAAALGATVFTVLVVRLVLRGNPDVHHATDVRQVIGQQPQPAIVYSDVGLYIPRDGDQRVALTNTSDQFVSYVTPLAVPPMNSDNDFPANMDYVVPIPADASTSSAAIDVPFRSTLKKLQAKWCGELAPGVRANAVQLNPFGSVKKMIQGSLDNLTGVDLKNVYIAFHNPGGEDYILYVPSWPATGASSRIDLAQLLTAGQLPWSGGDGTRPTDEKACWGDIKHQWADYWDSSLGNSEQADDLGSAVPTSFPMLSLYDRIPPTKRDASGRKPRVLLRRGERNLDMSQALGAGELVVLAQAQASTQPLPFPLEVNGDKVGGEGTVFYQFALPLDHGNAYMPPKVAGQ